MAVLSTVWGGRAKDMGEQRSQLIFKTHGNKADLRGISPTWQGVRKPRHRPPSSCASASVAVSEADVPTSRASRHIDPLLHPPYDYLSLPDWNNTPHHHNHHLPIQVRPPLTAAAFCISSIDPHLLTITTDNERLRGPPLARTRPADGQGTGHLTVEFKVTSADLGVGCLHV